MIIIVDVEWHGGGRVMLSEMDDSTHSGTDRAREPLPIGSVSHPFTFDTVLLGGKG